MKILTAAQMAEVDRLSTARFGIPPLTLMENAGRHVAEALRREFPAARRVTLFCGKGNNGGDGFVAARYLRQQGIQPSVVLCGDPAELAGDARVNYEALLKTGAQVEVVAEPSGWGP